MSVDQNRTERIARALRRVGVLKHQVSADGDLEFALNGIPGFAYHVTAEGYRLTFVLESELILDGEGWVAEHSELAVGFVRFIVNDDDDGSLLYSADVDYETDLGAVADIALDLYEELHGASDSSITETLAAAGILRPPLGPGADGGIRAYGPWWWGSRRFDSVKLYMFELEEVVQAVVGGGAFFAMSHAGHGLNSYGLNVVTSGGPFAAFVQHGFGGVYMDPLIVRIRINTDYSRLHVLLSAEPLDESGEPRWLVAYSEFRGVCGLVDLDRIREGSTVEDSYQQFENFEDLARGAAAMLPDSEDFGAAGVPVDWSAAMPRPESRT